MVRFISLDRIFYDVLGRFPFVRTGWPDHCPTSQFDNEIGFFQEFLLKNHLLGTYYLGFDWSGWRVFIKSEIIIATGMVWPVSSDEWKAPLVFHKIDIRTEKLKLMNRNTLYYKVVQNEFAYIVQV